MRDDQLATGMSPRGRRPRLDDVAKAAGVSAATVSLVLRNAPGPSRQTRELVIATAQRLGYRPDRTASLLARRRTELLGVVLDVQNAFHAELVCHLHQAADRHGYDLVLSTVAPSRSEQRAVETLLDFRCEALLLIGPTAADTQLAHWGQQLPLVVVGRRVSADNVDVVRSADDAGVGQAVEHLAGLGHRDITLVDGGAGRIATDRRRGYRQAMRRHGLAEHMRIIPGDPTEEAGIRAARSLLAKREAPTAVIAFNDRCALGLLDAFIRAGVRIPDAMSLVGYDDSLVSRLAHVQLTTISQNADQQAERAVAAAHERLRAGRISPSEVVLPPRLVPRATTGARPAVAGSLASRPPA